jgi:hypothetical protein
MVVTERTASCREGDYYGVAFHRNDYPLPVLNCCVEDPHKWLKFLSNLTSGSSQFSDLAPQLHPDAPKEVLEAAETARLKVLHQINNMAYTRLKDLLYEAVRHAKKYKGLGNHTPLLTDTLELVLASVEEWL